LCQNIPVRAHALGCSDKVFGPNTKLKTRPALAYSALMFKELVVIKDKTFLFVYLRLCVFYTFFFSCPLCFFLPFSLPDVYILFFRK
jgi:hypothetical protein